MKIQILISKKSWANEFKSLIKLKLSKFSKNIKIYDHHNKLKKNFDVNIIFSSIQSSKKIKIKFGTT